MTTVDRARADAHSDLYPFLYADTDTAGLRAQMAASAGAKAAEILTLRRQVVSAGTDRLLACATAIADAARRGGRLFTFGNGGSSSDAQQVATTFLHPPHGRPVPALSLSNDTALVTALSNDAGFDVVFARQLAAFARSADVALGLSTSGGSANVLRAFEQARRLGMLTIGFAGYDGGLLAESAAVDHLFVVPSSSVHRIQEVQTTLYHLLWELTQAALSAGPAVPGEPAVTTTNAGGFRP